MPVFVTERDIAAPLERVWPVLADVTRWHEWTTSITRVEPLGAPALAVGARFRVLQPKLQPAVFTVTVCDPPRTFRWVMGNAVLGAVADHTLVATPGGCRVTLRLEYTGLLGGLVAALYRGLTIDYMEREAAGLERRAGGGAQDPPGSRPARP